MIPNVKTPLMGIFFNLPLWASVVITVVRKIPTWFSVANINNIFDSYKLFMTFF